MEIQGSMLRGKVQKLEEMGRGLICQTACHGFDTENYILSLYLCPPQLHVDLVLDHTVICNTATTPC